MVIASALLALTLSLPQEPAQGGFITVQGKAIPLRLTAFSVSAPPEGFLTWKGWGYLEGATPKLFEPYRRVTDWSEVAAKYEAVKSKEAPVWREKIVVFARTDRVHKLENGVLTTERDILSDANIQEVLEAIARAKAFLKAQTAGSIEFVPDVEIERDTIRNVDDPSFAANHFEPRINGGGYEPEDKVFRGPYNGAIYILPGISNATTVGKANGVMVHGVPLGRLSSPTKLNIGAIEASIVAAVQAQASARLDKPIPFPGTPEEWAAASLLAELTAEELNARAANPRVEPLPAWGELRQKSGIPFKPSWIGSGISVSFVDDAERGQVLKYSEDYVARTGGLGLPIREDGSPLATIEAKPTLTFFMRSARRDPIAIRVQDPAGKAFWVSVGREAPIPSDAVVASAPFVPNGLWQKVAVDLRPVAERAGVTAIQSLSIEPTPAGWMSERQEFGAGEYFFSDFMLSAEPAQPLLAPATPSVASEDALARALAAAQATATSPELIALLNDPSVLVRLNAAQAFTRIKDPMAEAALSAAAGDLAPAVQEAALQALAFQGTENAITQLRNVLRFNLSDHAKGIAATLLAKTNDPKYAGDLLLLFNNPSWQAKIAGIQAMTMMTSVDSKFRLGFLRHENPAVRLAAVEAADLKSDEYRSALRWHAVNDPSDRVRAAAYAMLIQTEDPALKDEGYRGVRDDSILTRTLVLLALLDTPSESHRPAALLAIADRSATVRALGLNVLAATPGEAKIEDVTNVLEDRHPEVQLGLIAVAKAKKVTLPAATVEAMKSSPDKRVTDAVATLG